MDFCREVPRRRSISKAVMSRIFSRLFIPGSAFVTLLLGLLVTDILFVNIRALEQTRWQGEFEQRALERIEAVQNGLDEAVDALATVNRLFMTVQPVARAQFDTFTRPMLRSNPHIHLIAFQRLVPDAGRAAFEAERRRQFPGFTIREPAGDKLVPAAHRARYRVVDYLAPIDQNQKAFGLDAASRKEQDEAARRACDTGRASMTGQHGLLLDSVLRPGFLLFKPVYRAGATQVAGASNCALVIGYTTVGIGSAALIEHTLEARHLLTQPGFAISVHADRAPSRANLVFSGGGAQAAPSWFQTLLRGRPGRLAQTFEVAGRPWHIVVSAAPQSLLHNRLGSLLMLVCGVAGSILAAAYIGVIAARSRSVQRMVDERTAALTRVSESLQLRQQAIEACVNSIIITSAEGPGYPIEYVNPAFEKMTGYPAQEVAGCSYSLLWGADSAQGGVRDILAMVEAKQEGHAVLRTYRKDGAMRWSEAYIAPVNDAHGDTHHFVVAHYDVTEKRRYQEELEYQATHDTLTGLVNRKLLRERLQQEIAGAEGARQAVWVLFLDLDRFKFVNDSLGHRAGDEFLKAISERLVAAVRPGDTVARLGGDEFTLVWPERAGGPLTSGALDRIMDAVARPVIVDSQEFFLSCSVGIASYPNDSDNPDTLIEFADLAMFRAKLRGRHNVQYFMPEMSQHAQERLQLERDLRTAIERDEFELHYQPQVDLRSGRMVGVEALLRWRHPELGLVLPQRFIGLAEETGLIVPLGAWIMRSGCAQASRWQQAGLGELRLAINLAARQFNQPELLALVAEILDQTGLPAGCLELELTEALVMSDVARTAEVLHGLRALGVKLAIDNFGTGYSSLAHLKQFPIDVLKIDQSFVREISHQGNDAAIANAIISMAHGLGLRVVAQGVETEVQCEFLSRNMCDEMQGHLFSEALDAGAMEALLTEGRALPDHLLRMHKRAGTLLLVDDEPNILAALKRQLRGAGYRILSAPSGAQGLALMAAHEVDVIVSDQRMPGMTGVEFLRMVKTLHPGTVRIVLSGFTELQSVTDAVNEGAIYKFLTKPWDDTQLREHIKEAFHHKEMADENRRLDLEVRTANHGLAQANRQLGDVLRQQQEQIDRTGISLDIVREALQHVPLPILGLDEDEVVAFANLAAQDLFKDRGLLLGSDAEQCMPGMLGALQQAQQGAACTVSLHGASFELIAHSMGKGTRSRGKLIVFKPSAARAPGDDPGSAPGLEMAAHESNLYKEEK
jgi:diguanylate cyclase (GGDEF)-like protein/PAS domain S-box-containing protein